MSRDERGSSIKGIVDEDASSGVEVTLYPSGSLTALTLGDGEYLTITDINLISPTGGAYTLSFGATAAGLVVKGNADALGGLVHEFVVPVTGPAGVVPTFTEAGTDATLIITGYITKA